MERLYGRSVVPLRPFSAARSAFNGKMFDIASESAASRVCVIEAGQHVDVRGTVISQAVDVEPGANAAGFTAKQLLDVPDEEEQAGINVRHLKTLNKTGLLRGTRRGPVYVEKH